VKKGAARKLPRVAKPDPLAQKGYEPLLSQWLVQTTRVNTSRSGISIVAFRADLACPDCPGLQILLR
jgi:hypothetical protein